MIREANLKHAIEKVTSLTLLHHFFTTGRLASLAMCKPCNDEEYLMSTLEFAQELAQYAVGRAIEGDAYSISVCTQICNELNAKMLAFDFRNGPLRRKYDGLKYAIKKLEDITYELSLIDHGAKETGTKRRRVDDSDSLLCGSDFDNIKERMDNYDRLREQVIKDSRDVQKLSKQAIFSVHRGKLGDSQKQQQQAVKTAKAIMAVVDQHPSLRWGSFSNSLEELTEAVLTCHWVKHSAILTKTAVCENLTVEINTHEYIGALSDFTGEIARVAVKLATNREMEGVKAIHMALVIVSEAMMQLNMGGKYTKKLDAVVMSTKKVARSGL